MSFLRHGSARQNMPHLLNLEMQLRKCCNHPWLIKNAEEKEIPMPYTEEEFNKKTVEASGKMVFLDKLLPKLLAEGHKCLIFSQMKKVLDILERFIRFRKYKYERLDGGTNAQNRREAIKRFNDPSEFFFSFTK